MANYKGSNLRAVQNPRTAQTALILSTSGNPELWIANTPYERPRRITNNKSNESGPCWSPDGRRMIVTSDTRGKPQLYEVFFLPAFCPAFRPMLVLIVWKQLGIQWTHPGSHSLLQWVEDFKFLSTVLPIVQAV